MITHSTWHAKPERFQFKSFWDDAANSCLFFVKFGPQSLNGTSVHGGSIAHVADEVMCVAAHLSYWKDNALDTWIGLFPATAQIVVNIRKPSPGSKMYLYIGSVEKKQGNKYFTKFCALDDSSDVVAEGSGLVIVKRYRDFKTKMAKL